MSNPRSNWGWRLSILALCFVNQFIILAAMAFFRVADPAPLYSWQRFLTVIVGTLISIAEGELIWQMVWAWTNNPAFAARPLRLSWITTATQTILSGGLTLMVLTALSILTAQQWHRVGDHRWATGPESAPPTVLTADAIPNVPFSGGSMVTYSAPWPLLVFALLVSVPISISANRLLWRFLLSRRALAASAPAPAR